MRDLQEDFALEDWVKADKNRRREYFAAVVGLRTTAEHISASVPSDGELVELLAYVLRNDSVLREHVRKKAGTQPLSSDDWEHVLRAAAGTICECYYAEEDDG